MEQLMKELLQQCIEIALLKDDRLNCRSKPTHAYNAYTLPRVF